MYKINIHAHTIFSDGCNTPYVMAQEAKRLGFTALVVTDHYYAGHFSDCGLSEEKWKLLRKACNETTEVLPVILGIEYTFGGEEVLCFGTAFINAIFGFHKENTNDRPTLEWMTNAKQSNGGACILCHPCMPENWERIRPVLDGFEKWNAGQDCFGGGERPFGALEGLPQWCNSDAHQVTGMERAHNIVDKKITNEHDLIRYIRSGKQPEFCTRKLIDG